MKIERLSIIIPCYQEEENVPRFQEEVINCFRDYDFTVEYLFVNDGSTDDTLQELEKLAKNYPSVQVLNHFRNLGLGACFLTAFDRVTGDAILTLDADLTFHPREFRRLYDAYGEGIDCVTGSPFLGNLEGVPFLRRFLTKGVNFTYRLFLNAKISAVSSIFRLYRTSAVKKYQFQSHSFQINAEILIRFIQDKRKVMEVPVTLTRRIYGRSKINFIREIINHLVMFARILRWRFGL